MRHFEDSSAGERLCMLVCIQADGSTEKDKWLQQGAVLDIQVSCGNGR